MPIWGNIKALPEQLCKSKHHKITLNFTFHQIIIMYSEKLETLIDSIIAKGTITQEERNLLYDKAKEWSEDVSKNEIDLYVDKRLKFEFNHKHDPQVFDKVLVPIGYRDYSPHFQYLAPFKVNTLPTKSEIYDLVIIFLEHVDSDKMELLFAFNVRNGRYSYGGDVYHNIRALKIDTNQGLCISNVNYNSHSHEFNTGRMCNGYSLQINEAILRKLCDSSEFTVTMRGYYAEKKENDYPEFDLQFPLRHFQFYLQTIYNALFDNEVYPNIKAEAKKAEEQRIAKEKAEKEEKEAAETERTRPAREIVGKIEQYFDTVKKVTDSAKKLSIETRCKALSAHGETDIQYVKTLSQQVEEHLKLAQSAATEAECLWGKLGSFSQIDKLDKQAKQYIKNIKEKVKESQQASRDANESIQQAKNSVELWERTEKEAKEKEKLWKEANIPLKIKLLLEDINDRYLFGLGGCLIKLLAIVLGIKLLFWFLF